MDKQRPEKEPIMATKLDNAQKGQLSDQLAEVYRVTSNGTRDFSDVRKSLQDIIEGKLPTVNLPESSTTPGLTAQPSWYVSPEQQLERVRQLNAEREWCFLESDIPSIPENFTPRTSTEVLMLCVYLPHKGKQSKIGVHITFDELWDLIQAPDGYTKYRWDELKATAKLLRLAPGYRHEPGIRWIAFDPNAYHGLSPEAALKQSKTDGVRLAGTEVLMAALLFPTWATSWNGKSSPFPNLSGLQFYWDADWSDVPYLSRWDGGRQLRLGARWAGDVYDYWSSPVARECKN